MHPDHQPTIPNAPGSASQAEGSPPDHAELEAGQPDPPVPPGPADPPSVVGPQDAPPSSPSPPAPVDDLARRVHAVSHLTGRFLLRSGATSNEYFDKYRFESDPRLLRELAQAMAGLLPRGADGLAGLELGGVPLATVLSQLTGLPAGFVRKQAKPYGTRRLAEGLEVGGRRLVVVEDVVTSGGAVVDACRALRDEGAEVDVAICVIDREAGGPANLAEVGVELRSLFTMTQLTRAAGPPRPAAPPAP
jgi:orotate phosphoribosyltransferase